MTNDTWRGGIDHEFSWWKNWLAMKGDKFSSEYEFRTDPESKLQAHITKYLRDFTGDVVKIIDVGAGLMTCLGKSWDRARIEITAVDALADLYDTLDFPPNSRLVKTMKCETEHLTDKFPFNHYDVAHARNTLDHGYDPLRAVTEMINVVKPGQIIILDHFTNEATKANWEGLHQWNFCVQSSDMIISNRTKVFSLASAISRAASIVYISPEGGDVVFCVLRKHA